MSGDEYRWHHDYARLALDFGFVFQNYRIKPCLDKSIGLIDIDAIIKDRDVGAIEKHINTVVEFSLDNDQTSVLDPNFVKIFHISQLAVQYLLFCKKYLDNTVALIKEEYLKSNDENKNLKRQIENLKQESQYSKKQIKELKSALNCQIVSSQNIPIYNCKECPKAFSTEEYLLAHIIRRHDSLANVVPNTSFQAETDKLQLEIKELKERLNNTEKFVLSDDLNKSASTSQVVSRKPSTIENAILLELQQKFELLKRHVENELQILQTQKFDEEKYKEWFETFLHKHENLYNRSRNDCGSQTDFIEKASAGVQLEQLPVLVKTKSTEGAAFNAISEVEKDDIMTQTDFSPQQHYCKNCEAQNVPDNAISYVNESGDNKEKAVDNNFEKFEEIIQEKVTGSIEKLQDQMQTFWNKIQHMETEKRQPNEEPNEKNHQQPNEPSKRYQTFQLHSSPEIPQKVIPKPRTRLLQPKSSSSPAINLQRRTTTENIKIVSPRDSTTSAASSVKTKPRLETTSESESPSTESETSESSDEEIIIHKPIRIAGKFVAKKPSITSTLGQRSITSLKQAAFTPDVQNELRKDVEKILNNHLQELGVSPNWTTLPLLSYQRAIKIVTHQASLAQKNIANYKNTRTKILKDVEKKLQDSKNTASSSSKLKNLLSNVKKKAKSVAKLQSFSQPTPQVRTPKSQTIQQNTTQNESKTSMYRSSTDSESHSSQEEAVTAIYKANPKKMYSNVIQELKANVSVSKSIESAETTPAKRNPKIEEPDGQEKKKETDLVDTKIEAQAKSALKNYPSNGSLHKKKVLFDLEPSDEPIGKLEEKIIGTTSITSSVLDDSRMNVAQTSKTEKKVQELSDVSDWDLSEILN